jgi:LPXTG-site transpeptidase (sortase) family protein
VTARFLGLLLLTTAALVAGCATAVPVPTMSTATQPYEPVAPRTPPAPLPVAVQIPALGVASSLIPTGVDGNHRLQTPPIDKPEQASWFVGSPEPGENGPAVLLGHVNGSGKPGVFARLHRMQPGDEIVVNRDQASAVFYRVRSVEKFEKDEFPTERVYGDTAGPELRLITCGGVFDQERRSGSSRGSYTHNWVVFAELAGPPGRQ